MTDDHVMASAPRGRITVPTELAALAIGVPAATIRKWASRGKLTRYGSPGRAEYDLGELRDLKAKISPNCHPGQPEQP
ncbi:MAG TPA: MerR family transcriptional regulator [Streptosporangiaceae bacterium]|jgi:hypothetical protein